jgi:methionine-rich copper-binding protein CopC
VLAGAVLVLLAAAMAAPASAHTDLVSSTVAGGTWSPADGPVDLEFSTDLVPGRSAVVVEAGDEVRRVPATTFANHVQVELADLPAGPARLRFAVVGVDGHRIADEVGFEVRSDAGSGSSDTVTEVGPAPAATAASPQPGLPGLRTKLVVAGMLAALGLAAALSTVRAVATSRGRP